MSNGDVIFRQQTDQLWAKIADVWLPIIDEIMAKGFNPEDEDHQKCLQVMTNTIKGELYFKGLHP